MKILAKAICIFILTILASVSGRFYASMEFWESELNNCEDFKETNDIEIIEQRMVVRDSLINNLNQIIEH